MTLAPDPARDLMQNAHRLIAAGDWQQAAESLERAAAEHRAAGRKYDETRCLQLAATVRRSAGDPLKSRELIDRAAAIAPEVQNLPLAVAIATEKAQLASDEGRLAESVAAWGRAIDTARAAQATPENLSALIRKRAAAEVAAGRIDAASNDFEQAAALLYSPRAGFLHVEHSSMLAQHDRIGDALRILDAIDTTADSHLRAEVLVLRAHISRQQNQLDDAVQFANAARDAALEAVAPVSYFAAAGELAQAFDARSDLKNCYGALATAWATLGDLLGNDAARSWVEPLLVAYKFKWGDPEFSAARAAYEADRRAQIETERHA